MENLSRILTTVASIITIGFGIWHFFVPTLWDWYSYIESEATELVAAVRAINVFFSLSLVLFGVMNIVLINIESTSRVSLMVVLSASTLLWLTRVIMQIIYPQGSTSPALQYGMLITFIVVFACYLVSLFTVIIENNIASPF